MCSKWTEYVSFLHDSNTASIQYIKEKCVPEKENRIIKIFATDLSPCRSNYWLFVIFFLLKTIRFCRRYFFGTFCRPFSHGSGQFSRVRFTLPLLIGWQRFVSQFADTCAVFQKHDYDANYEEGQAGRGGPENVQTHRKIVYAA